MLKEFTKQNWLNLLKITKKQIPEILILRGTRNLKKYYDKFKSCLDDIYEVGSPNNIFENVLLGKYKNHPVGYASVYGDAMASEITHLFGVLGTAAVIQTGCCGALGAGILAGDVVCATKAFCGEGAAQYYFPNLKLIQASPSLIKQVENNWSSKVPLHKGTLWTTSALLAEGKKEIQSWAKKGCIAVDMETATTFAVAKYFKMDCLSLLFVFDNPRQGKSILFSDTEIKARRAKGEKMMLKSVFSIIENYRNLN